MLLMRIRLPLLFVFLSLSVGGVLAQEPTASVPSAPNEQQQVRRVSDHVWVIDGNGVQPVFPNVGIIVGSKATLVVDTGIGKRNGELVMQEVNRLSNNPELYLTFTHFHTEHSTGAQAFPPNTILIYSKALQEDIDVGLAAHVAMFSSRSPVMKELLQDWQSRPADILFDQEATIDLLSIT